MKRWWVMSFSLLAALVPCSLTPGRSAEANYAATAAIFDDLVARRALVGAQVMIGRGSRVFLEHYTGARSPGENQPVNADTLFCIGSDSKPVAAAVIMTLVAEKRLALEDPVAKWLPAFRSPKLADGRPAARPPTLRELLSHRAGIFSQKEEMTPQQGRLIRDFSLTLEQSVNGIAREPLIAQPGEHYAYSGAGYCVAGRAAEVATGLAFEALLQKRICKPLGLTHTSYFPPGTAAIAIGAKQQGGSRVPAPNAPHLHRRQGWNFSLVGGSLYSTVRDQARFARMVAGHGTLDGQVVIPAVAWSAWIHRVAGNEHYGLGWIQGFPKGGDLPRRLNHTGALGAYRAAISIDLQTGDYSVASWTLTLPENAEVNARIHQALGTAHREALRSETAPRKDSRRRRP
jgi:CubicO group peptidase (beta-lactamase class C family)